MVLVVLGDSIYLTSPWDRFSLTKAIYQTFSYSLIGEDDATIRKLICDYIADYGILIYE